jgi:hypothetical protein
MALLLYAPAKLVTRLSAGPVKLLASLCWSSQTGRQVFSGSYSLAGPDKLVARLSAGPVKLVASLCPLGLFFVSMLSAALISPAA